VDVVHVVPQRAADERLRLVEDVLRDLGIAPWDRAVGELVHDDLVKSLTDAGAYVTGSAWDWVQGDIEVHVQLASDADLIFFKTVVSGSEWS
jgi:hypothetical protein